MISSNDGLVSAIVLDGQGSGREIDWQGVNAWSPDDGVLWLHLDYCGEASQRWLSDESDLDPVVREALLAPDPRPRGVLHHNGLLIILRTVNLNAGAEPEDMVSVRIWIDRDRVVTMRHRKVDAIRELNHSFDKGIGPVNAGDLLVDLSRLLLDNVGGVVDGLDDNVSALEDEVLSAESYELRHRLADARRQAIALRRHIAPQREVIAGLQHEKVDWLSELDRARLREAADRLLRLLEELDAARERASVTQEELGSRLSELMNRRLYTLSIITAIFLPLGLVTGIFGVNVGGIPGEGARFGFSVLCVSMVVASITQLWLFRKFRWL